MPSYEEDLIRYARDLQRLATKRRRLKRNLKTVDGEIKHTRKLLNAVRQASEGRRPDAAPSRLHAGVTAVGTIHDELRPVTPSADASTQHAELFPEDSDGLAHD